MYTSSSEGTDSAVQLAYAANRSIGVKALRLLLKHDIRPCLLILPSPDRASHTDEIRSLLPGVPVIEGDSLGTRRSLALLSSMQIDYILSVHYPHLFCAEILRIPKVGTLNLHPAYLPFNRGWHTPSWAILEKTPMGATLHWVDEGVDTGDIALQRQVAVMPEDTADSLYKRTLQQELELLREAVPLLRTRKLPRKPQNGPGTAHKQRDLEAVRMLDLSAEERVGTIIDRIRALTTSARGEAAFFVVDGRRYIVRVEISEDGTEQQTNRGGQCD